jgi:prepilin-type N-terminal cleavage/methylation domain-containing protein
MKRNAMPTGRQGFSLVELLVVIAIIASIVSLAIPNFLSARQRAQDSKRKSEAIALKEALRLYYNDFNKYPLSFSGGLGKINYIQGCGAGGAAECPCSTSIDFASGVACDIVYMKKFPSDLGSSMYYFRDVTDNPDDFCLRVILNNGSDPDIATSQSRCASACSGARCNSANRYCVCAD